MTSAPDDTDARRAYWAQQMDEAHAFMRRALEHPVRECGESLVSLPELARDAGVEVRFSDRPHVQGLPRLFVLRRGQAESFVAAARAMNRRGWVMRVEDGFRNRTMQKFLSRTPQVFDAVLRKVVWELGGRKPGTDFLLKRLLALVAQTPKTGTHMSGSAIDISVLDRATGAEIDRGGPYLEMSELTPMDSPFVSDAARANRRAITAVMREAGFVEYPFEFWHYSSGDVYDRMLHGSAEPGRYGAVDYDPDTGVISPIPDPQQPLNTQEEITGEIDRSLARLGLTAC